MRVLWIVLLCLVGCQKQTLVVNQIVIDRLEGAELLSADRAALYAWSVSALKKQGQIAFREGNKEGGVLHVAIGAEDNVIFIGTSWNDESVKGSPLEASTQIPMGLKDKLKDDFERGVAKNLDHLYQGFLSKRLAGDDPVRRIHDALALKKVSDEELVSALRTIAERNDKKKAPLVAKVLKYPRMRPAMAALLALGYLGSEQVVDDVTDFAERKPTEVRRQVVEVLRKIGGHKAAAWLFTMSTGYDDEMLREQARLALVDVEGRLSKNPVAEVTADALPPTQKRSL